MRKSAAAESDRSRNSIRHWRYLIRAAWCGCVVWLVAIVHISSTPPDVLWAPSHSVTSDAVNQAEFLPSVGARLVSSAGAGREMGVLAPDSATALLVVSPECPVSAIHRSSYDLLVQQTRSRGLAFRVLITLFDGEATLFSRIAPQGMPVVHDASGALLRKLNISAFPALMILDASGKVIHSALPNPETVWTELPADF